MRTIKSRSRVATAFGVVLLVAAATFAARSAPATDAEVDIDQFTFLPQRITVKAGATVTWINEDDVPHTVASSSKVFKSKALDTAGKISFPFTTPRPPQKFFSFHPHNTGAGPGWGARRRQRAPKN